MILSAGLSLSQSVGEKRAQQSNRKLTSLAEEIYLRFLNIHCLLFFFSEHLRSLPDIFSIYIFYGGYLGLSIFEISRTTLLHVYHMNQEQYIVFRRGNIWL